MKITASNLTRWAGLAAMLAGICYVIVGIFHPANIPASVTTTRWVIVHIFACAMCFFGLLGMPGLYARQAEKSGWLGLIGYILLSLWLVMILGFSFVEAFILPHVATALPASVQAWMGMFNGPAGEFDLGVLPTLWTLSGPVYILGGLSVWHRDVPCRHPAAVGGRTPCPLDCLGPISCPAPQRISAENSNTDGVSTGLVGLCALV